MSASRRSHLGNKHNIIVFGIISMNRLERKVRDVTVYVHLFENSKSCSKMNKRFFVSGVQLLYKVVLASVV